MSGRGFTGALAMMLFALLIAAPVASATDLGDVSIPYIVTLSPGSTGSNLTVTGEAIRDALRAGDGHVFVNILQRPTAVGVWMTSEQAEVIDGFGDYRTIGTVVRVRGVLNVACPLHGGDFDIHATNVTLVTPSRSRTGERQGPRLIVAVIVLFLAGAMQLLYRRVNRRRFEL